MGRAEVRQSLRARLRPAQKAAKRKLRTKYAGRGRGRTLKVPPAAVSEIELELLERAAAADAVTLSYLVRAGALAEARKRLRRAGLL